MWLTNPFLLLLLCSEKLAGIHIIIRKIFIFCPRFSAHNAGNPLFQTLKFLEKHVPRSRRRNGPLLKKTVSLTNQPAGYCNSYWNPCLWTRTRLKSCSMAMPDYTIKSEEDIRDLRSSWLIHAKTASCFPIDPMPMSLRHCLSTRATVLPDISFSKRKSLY